MHILSRATRLQTPINLALNTALIGAIMLLAAACGGADDAQSPTDSQNPRATNGTNASTSAAKMPTTGSQPTERSNQAPATAAPRQPTSSDGAITATGPTPSNGQPATSASATSIPSATEEPETPQGHDPIALRLLDVAASYWNENRLRSNRYVAIGHYAGRAIETAPTLAAAYFLRAHAHNGLDRFDLALADLDRAFQLHDEAPQPASRGYLYDENTGVSTSTMLDYAHIMRAYALTRKGQHDAAQQSLDAQNSTKHEAEIVQMLIDHNTGNFRQAGDACCRSLGIYSIGNKPGAGISDQYPQPDLDVEIKLDPSNTTALTERAKFHIVLGDYEAARADLDALGTAGVSTDWLRAALHRASRDYEAVARDYTEFLASEQIASLPDHERWHFHFVRGQAHLETGRPDAALADFEQSLAFLLSKPQEERDRYHNFDRAISSSRYAVGLTHILNGEHQSGLAAYCGEGLIPECDHEPLSHLVTHGPNFYDSDDPWLHIYAGLANCAQRRDGDFTCIPRFDTLYRFEHAIELDPSNTTARELRAIAHLAHHGVEHPRSDSYFEEALETHPDPAALYRFRIPLLTKAALWDAVVADYDVLIPTDAENAAEHHFQRGQAHSNLENRDAAEADYLKALEMGYDQERVRYALTQLAR